MRHRPQRSWSQGPALQRRSGVQAPPTQPGRHVQPHQGFFLWCRRPCHPPPCSAASPASEPPARSPPAASAAPARACLSSSSSATAAAAGDSTSSATAEAAKRWPALGGAALLTVTGGRGPLGGSGCAAAAGTGRAASCAGRRLPAAAGVCGAVAGAGPLPAGSSASERLPSSDLWHRFGRSGLVASSQTLSRSASSQHARDHAPSFIVAHQPSSWIDSESSLTAGEARARRATLALALLPPRASCSCSAALVRPCWPDAGEVRSPEMDTWRVEVAGGGAAQAAHTAAAAAVPRPVSHLGLHRRALGRLAASLHNDLAPGDGHAHCKQREAQRPKGGSKGGRRPGPQGNQRRAGCRQSHARNAPMAGGRAGLGCSAPAHLFVRLVPAVRRRPMPPEGAVHASVATLGRSKEPQIQPARAGASDGRRGQAAQGAGLAAGRAAHPRHAHAAGVDGRGAASPARAAAPRAPAGGGRRRPASPACSGRRCAAGEGRGLHLCGRWPTLDASAPCADPALARRQHLGLLPVAPAGGLAARLLPVHAGGGRVVAARRAGGSHAARNGGWAPRLSKHAMPCHAMPCHAMLCCGQLGQRALNSGCRGPAAPARRRPSARPAPTAAAPCARC